MLTELVEYGDIAFVEPAKTSPTKKPSEQYLRSASPDPEHAQR
jgi:hypothetical protein